MSKVNLPSVPRSADRDTTVFLQALKKSLEDMSVSNNGEASNAVKDYVSRVKGIILDDFKLEIEESTSLDAILDLIQGSITESQLSIDLGKRIELILTNETAISEETKARIAEMLATNERISTEVTQRQDQYSETTGRIDIILANTDENRATIVEEVLARTSLTDAHASRLNALDVKTEGSDARIGTLETATADNTEAVANSKTELRAEFAAGDDLNRAAINSESTARSSADTALGSRVDTVQAISNGNVSSIQVQSNVIAGINVKLNATWSVKADVNGVVGGIALGNDGVTVDFIVRASTFAVQGPSGSKSVPFVVYPDGTVIDGMPIPQGVYMTDAYIRRAAIDTLRIRGQAVTVMDSAKGGAYSDTPTIYLDSGGAKVLVRVHLFGVKGYGDCTVRIYKDGSQIDFFSRLSVGPWDSFSESFEVVTTAGSGNSTYIATFEGIVIKSSVITVMSLKR